MLVLFVLFATLIRAGFDPTFATTFSAQGVALPNFDWIPFPTSSYTGYTRLSPPNGLNKTVELYWKIDQAANEVEFGIASNHGATWLALGTSEAGGMRGANIWLGRANDQGTFVLEERFTPIYGPPELTLKQSLKLLSSFQTPELTAFTFRRSLDGCGGEERRYIDIDRPIWIIYAFGTSNRFTKHLRETRGQVMVDLNGAYFSKFPEVQMDENTEILSLMTPRINLAQNESTTYCYSYHDFSSFPEKRQIIAENITIGSPYLHHMLGFLCNSPPDVFTKKPPGTIYCNNYRTSKEDRIEWTNECSARPYITWSKGGGSRIYPEGLGKPIGPGALETRYMVIEHHFDNSDLEENAFDPGSGFKLTVTKKLRAQDIGMLTVGRSVLSTNIEPGKIFSTVGECGSSCTSKFNIIPEKGLTPLTTLIHMHKRGYGLQVQHVRNGKELLPFPSSNYFDFNLQSFMYVSVKQDQILRGDRIIATCTYDTRADTQPIKGGYSSDQEMCLAWIEYYPAVPIYSCVAWNRFHVPEFNYCPVNSVDPGTMPYWFRQNFTPWTRENESERCKNNDG